MERYGRVAGIFKNDKSAVEMDVQKKIRVAMVCHFSKQEVRERLCLTQFKFVNMFRRLFRRAPLAYHDFAPWIDCITSQVPAYESIEMHVISPHRGMVKKEEKFVFDKTNYHFFKSKPSLLLRLINRYLFHYKLVKYRHNKRMITSFIDKINPDIVVLVGAENPYYSSALLGLKNYPLFILCQTVYNNEEFRQNKSADVFNNYTSVEKELIMSTRYVGVYSEKHRKLLRDLGYKGFIFDFQWPNRRQSTKIERKEIKEIKKYDFINFAARMSFEKGYHDSVQALAIVKKKYPDIRLALVDNGDVQVKDELERIIKEEHLEDNVTFIPFFEKISDLFQFLQEVKYAVLPCKVDYISGTQLQSMRFGLPIVVYKTDGTPSLNKDTECALIAEKDDVADLARQMLRLIEEPELAKSLSENGIAYIRQYKEQNEGAFGKLLSDFNAIVGHYTQGALIPSELLLE